ncbi:hypothetical protein EB796_001384 [Bugula neritina]|uniref:Uncharacterized protein n=1 Tax=Bugula neritina TaxID=10212 RepID=A0A7J7KQ24_BUGNE|nr:hypothetical protein EB796_001384 [Bugula neritina]
MSSSAISQVAKLRVPLIKFRHLKGVLAVQDNRPSTSEILALKHEIVSAASDLPSSRFRRKLIDTNEMEFIQVYKLFMK